MDITNLGVRDWPTRDLRLAYFDFTVRGEGPAEVVRAVLLRWHELGALGHDDLDRWLDALEWREGGGFLPGWTLPREMPASVCAEVAHGDWDELRFEHWRARRRLATPA
jgi:hypothetical protein